MHLLGRKTRAALGHDMSRWDWICHFWWMLISPRYRLSVRRLKEAFALPEDPYLVEATKDLRQGTAYDNEGVMDFTPKEMK